MFNFRSRRTARIVLVLIIIVGSSLRMYHLTERSLWFDEAFSWRLIQFPLTEMIERAADDVHPPLYYLLLKAWHIPLGSTLLSLRFFSVLWAGATIAVTYLFASYAARSRAVALLAALLLALSGFQIQYAWEARMYTLGTTLVVLSSYVLLKALRQAQLRWWLSYALVATALAYTHYFAFFSIAAQVVFAIGYLFVYRPGQRQLLVWRQPWLAAAAAALATLAYIPWLPTFIRQNTQVQESFWIPSIGGWSIPDTFYRMFAPTSLIPQHSGVFWIILAVLPIVATLIGWYALALSRRVSSPRDGRWLIALSGFIPFVLTIVTSFLGQSLYQDRFFVFAHPFIIVGLAVLLISLRPRALRTAAATLAVLGFAIAFGRYWVELDIPNKPGAHAATQIIAQNAAPGEPILVSSPFVFFAIDHYVKEQYRKLPDPKLYSATGELVHFAGGPILTDDDLAAPALLTEHGLSSAWVVDTTGFGSTPLALSSQWQIDQHASFPEVFSHQGDIIVTRYVKIP